MKVYFSASVSARAVNDDNDRMIVDCLKNIIGNNVYSGHIFDNEIEKKFKDKGLSLPEIREKSYTEIMKKIIWADLMVAEISYPSISLGYEISYALNNSKQILLLHLPSMSSRLIEGIKNPNLNIIEYTSITLKEVLEKEIERINKEVLVRFNMFIPNSLMAYLDWVTKDSGMNKSEYVRGLIEKEIRKR